MAIRTNPSSEFRACPRISGSRYIQAISGFEPIPFRTNILKSNDGGEGAHPWH